MPNPLPLVLLVDDDRVLTAMLAEFMAAAGLRTIELPNSAQLSATIAQHEPALVVLDLMMPGESGLAALRRLTAERVTVPMIMLTARGDDVDRIVGLELGAADYVPKPFNPRELLARAQAVLRRSGSLPVAERQPQAPTPQEQTELHFGAFVLNPAQRELLCAGEKVALTSIQFNLLTILAAAPGVQLTRAQLVARCDVGLLRGGERAIDVQVSRLRKRLAEADADVLVIETSRGVGYRFVAPLHRAKR